MANYRPASNDFAWDAILAGAGRLPQNWVHDWVQVAGSDGVRLARKLRRVNESIDGYEPGGRRFESCRAHQINKLQPSFSVPRTVVNNSLKTASRWCVAGLGMLRRVPQF